MIQIELAGPGNPASFRVAPDRIRKLASKVGSFCVEEGKTGGFVTSTLEPMGNWLTSAAGTFEAPFRTYLFIARFLPTSSRTPFPPKSYSLPQTPPSTPD